MKKYIFKVQVFFTLKINTGELPILKIGCRDNTNNFQAAQFLPLRLKDNISNVELFLSTIVTIHAEDETIAKKRLNEIITNPDYWQKEVLIISPEDTFCHLTTDIFEIIDIKYNPTLDKVID